MLWTKRILKWFGITLLVFVGLAIAIPYFFKAQILDKAKSEANKYLNATLDFKDVGLSLLWSFPNFTFTLDKFSITGKDEFEGLKLVDIEQFKLSLDLWSVFSGKYAVNGITLNKPQFYVKVLNNGKANYDIVKPDSSQTAADTTKATPASTEPTAFKFNLEYYSIQNANITYDDAPGDMFVKIQDLTHTGSGDFTATEYDVYTKTKIEAMTVAMSGIKYLNKTNIEAIFNTNVSTAKGLSIKLLENDFRFNDLRLKTEGSIDMPNDKDINLDLTFKAYDTKFSSVLSMIPAAYTKDFKDVKTSGTFKFNGHAKGTYNEKSLPGFGLHLSIDNGTFQYPSLPLAIKEIKTSIDILSPSSDLDKMSIDIPQFHMLLGANPFDMSMKVLTPMSDLDVDAKLNGRIDLTDLKKAYPMEGTELSGIINTNLEAKTKVSYVTSQQYDKVIMKGLLGITAMNYTAAGYPQVKINSLQMDFTPNNVNLKEFDLNIGKSDIRATGLVDNLLTYFSGDKIMKGNLNITSNFLDLNELSSAGGTTSTDTSKSAPTALEVKDTTTKSSADNPMFDKFDFAANVTMNKIVYDVYEIQNLKAAGSFSPSLANLSNFEMLMGKVDIQANGRLENVFNYLFDGQMLRGTFVMNSNYMNLNQFMRTDGQATEPAPSTTAPPTDPSTAPAEYEPILVPHNLDFRFTSKINTFIYDVYNLKNVACDIIVQNQTVKVQNLSSNFLGGLVKLQGEYSSLNPKKPTFEFAYDLAKMDFVETYKTIGLVKSFLPIFESIQGKFSSQLKIKGILGKNMYPDLASLNADGLLETFDANLGNLTAVKTIAEKLKSKELEKVLVTNTKNYFEIKDGRFTLKPFSTVFQKVDMLMEGSHGLDNSLDYKLKLSIPRALLEKNPVGDLANTGLKALQGEASKLGLNLEQGEFINVGVDIIGNMTKPEYKVKLLGVAGKGGNSLIDQAKAEAEARLRAEAEKLKAEAEAKLKAETDKVKAEAAAKAAELEAKARAEADRARAEAEAKLKAETERIRQETEKLKAEAETKTKAEADKLRAEAEAKRIEAENKAKAEMEKAKKEAEQKLKDKLKLQNPFGKKIE